MRKLSIDIETRSGKNIESGVHVYCEDDDFSILLFAYAFDDETVQLIDLTETTMPTYLLDALTDPDIIKTAYNAAFEINCLSAYFGIELDVSQWRCTMIQALEAGLPASLEQAAEASDVEQQKDSAGKRLIRFFCIPDKDGKFKNPSDYPEKWEQFKEYCIQDVYTERDLRDNLPEIPESEHKLWVIDQSINNRGVKADADMCRNSIAFYERYTDECFMRMKEVTGLENPNSVSQLKAWLESRGIKTDSLSKSSVSDLLSGDIPADVREVLELRRDTAKTSIKKYSTMLSCICSDSRIRGLLQFYGTRTGRWAGRFIQPQNLPQNHISDLDFARKLVSEGKYDLFDMCYDVPQTLSELIRTALIPSENCRFIVSDFSAIEARVIAWLAGEQWRMNVFRENGDIYCASASAMFKVPVEKHGVNSHLRQKGKISELALGYGGSVGALISMGALKMGLDEDELSELVTMWRNSNPKIVRLWYSVENAAVKVIKRGGIETVNGRIRLSRDMKCLYIALPNGRRLTYREPSITTNRFGSPSIAYKGLNQTSKKWETIETFGGKLVENIIQAIARDCLAESIIRLENAGFKIVFHVHDEVIIDCPKGVSSAEEVAEIMGQPIKWADGLLLRAEAFESEFYKKD